MESIYDSRCQACGERIYVGDEILKDEDLDAWVHEDCYEPPLRIKAPPKKPKGRSLADMLESNAASVASPALKGLLTADPRRSVTLHEKDVEHVVQWLGWYMGEGNLPDSPGELTTMRKLVDALKPGDHLTQLSEHISYAEKCGIK